MGLVALQHVGSSRTRVWIWVSCIGRRVLYHWATREAQKFILKAYLLHYTDLEAGHTKLKRGVDPAVVMLWWGEKTCLRRQGVCITRQGYILGRMQLTVQRFTMGNYFHKKYCKKSRRMLRALPLNTFLPMNTDLKHILKTLKRHYVGTEGIIKGHVQSFAP